MISTVAFYHCTVRRRLGPHLHKLTSKWLHALGSRKNLANVGFLYKRAIERGCIEKKLPCETNDSRKRY